MHDRSPKTAVPSVDKAGFLLLLLLTGWLYFWCAKQPGIPFLQKDPGGYYGALTAGFLQGQLSVAIEPHPSLVKLSDPYDPVANAPYRVHDMTYYRGKYYLYFGVTPAVIFFLPWATITGTHLTEPFAVAFFCFAGFVVGSALLAALRRRYYPAVSNFWLAALMVTWALGNNVLILMQNPGFYQVPIACAFMLLMLGLAAVHAAVQARTPGRATGALVLAGICVGLCLGCRPNYLPAACALVIPAAWIAWRWSGKNRRTISWGTVRFGASALVPVGLIGLGLLIYNYARFGDFLEFGNHYQLAGERTSTMLFLSPKFIPKSLPFYLFNGGVFTPYFPFLITTPYSPLGGLRYFPVCAAGILALWVLLKRPWDGRAAWLAALAAMGTGNLLLLSCYGGITDRYPPDFMPSLALLGAVGVMVAAQARPSKWIMGGLGLLLAVSCSAGLVLIFNYSPAKTRQFAAWERYFNQPSYLWMQATGTLPGLHRMEMVLAPHVPGQSDPLIESGMLLDRRDALTLEHLRENQVQFRFFHAGLGGPVSEPVPIEYGRHYTLEVLYGGMLPPVRHPYFAGWSDQEISAAKSRVLVRLDGRVVMDAAMASYDSRPADLRVGRSDYASGALAETFGGTLTVRAVERLRREDFRVADIPAHQPLRLKVRFPLDRTGATEPLVATGKSGLGDLIFVRYTGAGRLRFGIDHYGAGGPITHEVRYDPAATHEVLLWMGTWASPETAGRVAPDGVPDGVPAGERLFIALNHEVLMDSAQPFREDTPPDTVIGRNGHGSTAADALFTGRLIELAGMPYDSLPVTPSTNGVGAVVMSVRFPAGRVGASEPLVTSGVEGAGNLLYVRYVDNSHVIFGFDHWGIGGIVSQPVQVEYGRTYRLEMTMGSLYAPEDFAAGRLPAELKELVLIKLDDDIVLRGRSPCHPTRPGEIRVGENRIGGSTAGWDFFGQILGLERPARPTFPSDPK